MTVNWSTLNAYLAGAADVAHTTVFHNDMSADLKRIRAPVLVLSDGADARNAIDQRDRSELSLREIPGRIGAYAVDRAGSLRRHRRGIRKSAGQQE